MFHFECKSPKGIWPLSWPVEEVQNCIELSIFYCAYKLLYNCRIWLLGWKQTQDMGLWNSRNNKLSFFFYGNDGDAGVRITFCSYTEKNPTFQAYSWYLPSYPMVCQGILQWLLYKNKHLNLLGEIYCTKCYQFCHWPGMQIRMLEKSQNS